MKSFFLLALLLLFFNHAHSQEENFLSMKMNTQLSEILKNFSLLPYLEKQLLPENSTDSFGKAAQTSTELKLLATQGMTENDLSERSPQMSNQCKKVFLHVLNQFLNKTQFMNMLLFSGKNINDFGEYDSCNASPVSRYITFQINNLPIMVDIGLCIPTECQAEDLIPLSGLIASTIEKLIHKKGREGSTLDRYHIKKNDVQFIDPLSQTEENEDDIGIGFALALVYIILTAGFVLFSTYCDKLRENRLQKSTKQLQDFTISKTPAIPRNPPKRKQSNPAQIDFLYFRKLCGERLGCLKKRNVCI
jgi:hypothetical protein